MGDKLLDVLIVFMMIVIIGLGGIYYVKATGGANQNASINNNYAIYNESVQASVNHMGTNSALNVITNESKEPIDLGLDNSFSPVQNNKGSVAYNNRYYYNYLDEYSKAIYNAIVNNVETLKTGTGTIEIDYDFTNLWNNGNGQDELDYCYNDAVNALNLDVPDLFYIEYTKMSLNVEKVSNIFSTKYRLYISVDTNKYPNYYADGFNSKEQVNLAIGQYEQMKEEVKALRDTELLILR